MIFGLQAMDHLKTHTISYSADTSAFEPFFTKLSRDYNMGFKRDDTPPIDNTLTIVILTAIVLLPLAWVLAKILAK